MTSTLQFVFYKVMSYYSTVLFLVSYMWFFCLKRLYTLLHSTSHIIRDTTNLHTERKQIRSHMLLRTLISEINQHRNGRRSPPGTAPIKRLPTALKQAALPLYRVGVVYDHISFYIHLKLREVCKPRAPCMVTWIIRQPISPPLHVFKLRSWTSQSTTRHFTIHLTSHFVSCSQLLTDCHHCDCVERTVKMRAVLQVHHMIPVPVPRPFPTCLHPL
jgi:hypothetical protein